MGDDPRDGSSRSGGSGSIGGDSRWWSIGLHIISMKGTKKEERGRAKGEVVEVESRTSSVVEFGGGGGGEGRRLESHVLKKKGGEKGTTRRT